MIALTFDDGPSPETTEKILDILRRYNAKAAFFVVGRNAEKYQDIVKAIIDSGNEIGNHSWDHTRLTYKSPGYIENQIKQTDDYLRKLGYEGNIPFRAPYGHKLLILPYILMQADKTHYLWNIEFDDWDSPPLKEMLSSLKKQIRPGSICCCMTDIQVIIRAVTGRLNLSECCLIIVIKQNTRLFLPLNWKLIDKPNSGYQKLRSL